MLRRWKRSLQLGIESFKKGNYELAKYYLSSLWGSRAQNPVDEMVPLWLSESLVKSKDYQGAEKVLADYVSEGNAAPKIATRLGYVYILEKKYREARDLLLPLVAGNPSDTGLETRYYLAFAHYKIGETDRALEIADDVLAQNKAGAMHKDFFKLYILLLDKTKQADKSFTALRQYASLYPEDIRARVDLCQALLQKKDYAGIVREAEDVKKSNNGLARTDIYSFVVLTYLEGLSRVGVKSYKNAIEYFDLIKKESADSAKISGLYPYVLYYKAWSLYKLADYKNAIPLFTTIADSFPQSGLVAKSLYLAGWCLYSADDFEGASKYFARLADIKTDTSQRDKALFFRAMSFLNLKKPADAKTLFKSVYTDMPKSDLADDALFEYAGILDAEGKPEDAASSYMRVSTSYPDSPLAEDGLYRRAEVYFTGRLYDKAKNAFYDYRTKYPAGKLLDASLYWGGLTAFNLGEKSLATLLWERIINELPKSAYRANAIIKTAEIYSDSSEYSKTLSLYTELLMKYPVEASSVNAEEKAATLKYLVLGLSKKEAELVAAVERNSRDKTTEGRKAIVGLARLYMTEYGKDKLDAAYSILQPVLGHPEDIDATSDAQYLVAEYFNMKGDYVRAGNEFVKAAVASTNNKDRMAHSIYRAAEMMKAGGKTKDALDLVDRLEKSFPQSDWTIEGRKLVKGLSR
jgi:TolA-binding protein